MPRVELDISCAAASATRERPGPGAACRACIAARARSLDSVEVHRVRPGATGSLRVEVSYDDAEVSEAALASTLRGGVDDEATPGSGPEGGEAHRSVVLPLTRMRTRRASRAVERLLRRAGATAAAASHAAGAARVSFDPRSTTLEALAAPLRSGGYGPRLDLVRRCGPASAVCPARDVEAAGADVVSTPPEGAAESAIESEAAGPDASTLPAPRGLLAAAWGTMEVRLLLSAAAALGASVGVAWWGGPWEVRLALCIAVAAAASVRTGPDAWDALRHVHVDVDVLMFAAAIGAGIVGRFEEGAFLLWLFGLGAAGEHVAMARARGEIAGLRSLAPERAHRVTASGELEEVAVGSLALGDEIEVRPYERVPADGAVTEGESAIDEATITGESTPADKSAGSEVFASTVNGPGRLRVRVTRKSSETVLARVIEAVASAQASRGRVERTLAKVERVYAPSILALTALSAIAPPLLGWGSWSDWFLRSMAFMIAASPCALAIGTPAATLCGIAAGAKAGLLVKSGGALERLAPVRVIALDKTGTLTRGEPTVREIAALGVLSESEVLRLAGAVEASASHPLAAAIAEAASRGGRLASVSAVEQTPGLGAGAVVEGRRVRVGRLETGDGGETPGRLWDEASAAASRMRSTGSTVVAVRVEGVLAGLIALADEPRPEAAAVIARLRDLGVSRVVMLTGDHGEAAGTIGRWVGVDEVAAELMPEEKLERLTALRERWGATAMVGDGVNDAPALASATVGVAIGGAGAQAAMESADLVLMRRDLTQLPAAVQLAHAVRRTVRQNLTLAIATIAIVAPLGLAGLTHLAAAVLLHEGSTIVVVLNALRLLRQDLETVRGPMAADEPCPFGCREPCAHRGEVGGGRAKLSVSGEAVGGEGDDGGRG